MSPLDTPPFPATAARSRTYQGRFGRLSYIAWHAVLNCVAFFAALMLSASLGLFNVATLTLDHAAYILPTINNGFSLLFVAIYTYFAFVITIRRLHDVNLSGWWSLLGLVPVINFFLFVYLLLRSGHPTHNIYAAVRYTPFWEKLVAWLCILFVLFSLLSLVSLFGYVFEHGQMLPTQEIVEKSAEFF